MTKQMKKFEELKKIDVDEEALEKIRQIKSSGSVGLIRSYLFRRFVEDFFEPIQKKFHKKYPEINWDTVTDEEFPKDYEQALDEAREEVNKIIKNKSDEEILNIAKKFYQFYVEHKNFSYAYTIAKEFLDRESISVASQKDYEKKCREMKESKDEDIRYRAAAELLSLSFYPEIERPEKITEKAVDILFESDWLKKNPELLYSKLKGWARYTKWKLPKNGKIYNFVHPLARKTVEELIKKNRKEKVLERAQFLEKIGFLDIEKDNDLFEELTR